MGQAAAQRVLLTGATGFVGTRVGARLAQEGYQLVCLVRDVERARASLPFAAELHSWDAPGTLADLDAVVHLAGETIAHRWTEDAKRRIVRSRVGTTERLRELVAGMEGKRPKVYVGASAVGYYGDRGDEVLTELSAPGRGFLAETCVAWEAASHGFERLVPRTLVLRFGMVLGPGGGALRSLLPLFRARLGGPVGNGRQWVSWIHEHDLAELILFSLRNRAFKGVANAVSPEPVTNREFSRTLADALGTFAALPAPAFALKLALGEMSTLLLSSQRVLPAAAAGAGFTFRFPRLDEAFREILARRP